MKQKVDISKKIKKHGKILLCINMNKQESEKACQFYEKIRKDANLNEAIAKNDKLSWKEGLLFRDVFYPQPADAKEVTMLRIYENKKYAFLQKQDMIKK